MRILSTFLLAPALLSACGKQAPVAPPPPPVGWHTETGWSGECYAAPNWESLDLGARRMARQEALEAMKNQWGGQRDPAIAFDAGLIENVETVLLGRPEKIEAVTVQNHEACITHRKGGDLQAWEEVVRALPSRLTAGECLTPLVYTKFDYLDIGRPWQGGTPICKGDKVRIFSTLRDKYRVKDDGPWITAKGNDVQATGDYPCTVEGCTEGMLVGRFTSESGIETFFPIGGEKIFEAVESGTLHYTVNDKVYYDNRYYKGAQIEDRTAVTYEPVESK